MNLQYPSETIRNVLLKAKKRFYQEAVWFEKEVVLSKNCLEMRRAEQKSPCSKYMGERFSIIPKFRILTLNLNKLLIIAAMI